MKTLDQMDLSPATWYRRKVSGGDFSLEANTPAVPERGRFYVLHRGRNVFQSRKYREALSAYRRLCARHWKERLKAQRREQRIAAAWGLLDMDPEDPTAAQVIREDAPPAGRHRLEALRRRHRAQRRAALRRRKARS